MHMKANNDKLQKKNPNAFRKTVNTALKTGVRDKQFLKIKASYKINPEWIKKEKAKLKQKENERKAKLRKRKKEMERLKKLEIAKREKEQIEKFEEVMKKMQKEIQERKKKEKDSQMSKEDLEKKVNSEYHFVW